MQLGGSLENMSQVHAGTLLMTWVGMACLSRTVPELEAISLPFQFASRETVFRVVDGPVGELPAQRMADKGFISLGYMELRFRHVTTGQKPIRTVDDLRGLKIRLQPNETHLATFRAISANPVAMDIRAFSSALQQRVVDGQENPYAIIFASRDFEVQRQLTNTGDLFEFISTIANCRTFGALAAAQQQIIHIAMGNAIKTQREVAAKTDGKALAMLQARGMQYEPLPASELARMRQLSAGVVDAIKGRLGAELIDHVQAFLRALGRAIRADLVAIVAALVAVLRQVGARRIAFATRYAAALGRASHARARHRSARATLGRGVQAPLAWLRLSATAFAATAVPSRPPRSGVRSPEAKAASTAAAGSLAASAKRSPVPRAASQSSIIAAESSVAVGLARPLSAMSGAVPCAGWNTAWSSPISAEGAKPMPPMSPAPRSDSMSPNMFSVGSTSKSHGLRTWSSAMASTVSGAGRGGGSVAQWRRICADVPPR
jgi:TRAP-type C4-dicarboxylate transport system substrate-binding protein